MLCPGGTGRRPRRRERFGGWSGRGWRGNVRSRRSAPGCRRTPRPGRRARRRRRWRGGTRPVGRRTAAARPHRRTRPLRDRPIAGGRRGRFPPPAPRRRGRLSRLRLWPWRAPRPGLSWRRRGPERRCGRGRPSARGKCWRRSFPGAAVAFSRRSGCARPRQRVFRPARGRCWGCRAGAGRGCASSPPARPGRRFRRSLFPPGFFRCGRGRP